MNNPASVRKRLETDGVVHLRRVLPVDEIIDLRSHLASLTDSHSGKIRDPDAKVSEFEYLLNKSARYRESVAYKYCQSLAGQLFGQPARYGFDHAIIKRPGSGPVHWHQDQFYSKVDLDKQSLAFWIPLQRVSPENGGMEYQVGKLDRVLPHECVYPNSHTHKIADKNLPESNVICPAMEMGDICIHTPMTLHRSYPNDSVTARSAWIVQFNRFGAMRFFRWSNMRRHVDKIIAVAQPKESFSC